MQHMHARRIYRDDFELLHEGLQRFAKVHQWEVIERPSEPNPDELPDPKLITLEALGLERLRPVPEPPAPDACETCANRANPPGAGPCADCDLTFDGPDSNYSAESDDPVVLDAFALSAIEGDGEPNEDDGEPNEDDKTAAPGDDDEDEDDEDEVTET